MYIVTFYCSPCNKFFLGPPTFLGWLCHCQCLVFWFLGRTVVGPTSKMSACWRDRGKLKPGCRRGVVEPSWTQCLVFWFVGRTVVGLTSRMSTCWRNRGKLKPGCTHQIGNRELDRGDIYKQGGRSCSSPGPPHPTSATADA